MKNYIKNFFINIGIFIIKRAEPCKDENLSWRLHNLADQYARRPTGEWK